jgi:carboxymethylenebutenolidase
VIHEWWGLDEQSRSIADRFAELGYLAFAPDLFHGERAELGDSEKATVLLEKYAAPAEDELPVMFDDLRQFDDCSGRVGSVGFCFGGRMSLSLGLSRSLNALCTFYGGGMQRLFDRLNELHSPVLGLFGDQDRSIPLGTIEEFDRLLDEFGVEHEVVVYPNSGHAFFRDTDPNAYKPAAAADAWKRVQTFFERHLRGESEPALGH